MNPRPAGVRLPDPAPAEVAAAAATVRKYLDIVLREDRRPGSAKPLRTQDYSRVLHALRVVQALEGV
jgi:hypothetical protein